MLPELIDVTKRYRIDEPCNDPQACSTIYIDELFFGKLAISWIGVTSSVSLTEGEVLSRIGVLHLINAKPYERE